jgi:hypothetical protein
MSLRTAALGCCLSVASIVSGCALTEGRVVSRHETPEQVYVQIDNLTLEGHGRYRGKSPTKIYVPERCSVTIEEEKSKSPRRATFFLKRPYFENVSVGSHFKLDSDNEAKNLEDTQIRMTYGEFQEFLRRQNER